MMILGDVGGLIFFTKSNIMHNFASKIFLLLENCQLIEGLHFVGIKHIIMSITLQCFAQPSGRHPRLSDTRYHWSLVDYART